MRQLLCEKTIKIFLRQNTNSQPCELSLYKTILNTFLPRKIAFKYCRRSQYSQFQQLTRDKTDHESYFIPTLSTSLVKSLGSVIFKDILQPFGSIPDPPLTSLSFKPQTSHEKAIKTTSLK